MISRFYSIKENEGEMFKTTSYQHAQSIKSRIARISAFVQQHYIDQESYNDWYFKKNEGSFTFQNHTESHRVIKIFCDIDN